MRLDGWESRLHAVIEEARARPYELGTWDCFRMALRTVEALTGLDHWPQFEGRYRTRRQAVALIAKYGSSFEAAFDAFFHETSVGVRLASRGDIVALQTSDGEKHLGICLGVESVFLAPEGLIRIPTLTCLCAWKI